jgi:hypothetical protein
MSILELHANWGPSITVKAEQRMETLDNFSIYPIMGYTAGLYWIPKSYKDHIIRSFNKNGSFY